MKKIIISMCLVIILLLSSIVAYADTSTYELAVDDDFYIYMSFPSDTIVFTRDTPEDDPFFLATGIDKTDLNSILSGDTYLFSISDDISNTIYISVSPSDFPEFNSLSEKDLWVNEKLLKTSLYENGETDVSTDILSSPQTKFLIASSTRQDQNGVVNNITCLTYYKGYRTTIAAICNSDPSPILEIYANIISSITFSDTPTISTATSSAVAQTTSSASAAMQTTSSEVAASSSSTPSESVSSAESELVSSELPSSDITVSEPVSFSSKDIFYANEEAGVSFTIPAGWGERTNEQDKAEYIDTEGNIISFNYVDAWAEMSDSDKEGLTRSDIKNDHYTTSNMEDLFKKIDESAAISSVEYAAVNNIEYFKIVGINDTDTDITSYALLNDGYLYMFVFEGNTNTSAYQDFTSMLSSVQYKSPSFISSSPVSSALSGASVNSVSSKNSEGNLPAANIFLSILIAIAIYSLPVVVYRYFIKKESIRLWSKKTIILALIYGTVMLVLAIFAGLFISGNQVPAVTVILWSFVNYKLLVGTLNRTQSNDSLNTEHSKSVETSVEKEVQNTTKQLICKKCGAVLPPESKFCNFCGTIVNIDSDDKIIK